MKVYLSGDHSELERISDVKKQIGCFEHNPEIVNGVLSFEKPDTLSTSTSQADVFIFLMSKVHRPSPWTWYELGNIMGAASARQKELNPPKVFVCGKPELMLVEDWVIDVEEDQIISHLSEFLKQPRLSGVVIEDDDGYAD